MKFIKRYKLILIVIVIFGTVFSLLIYKHQNAHRDFTFKVGDKAVQQSDYRICESIIDPGDRLYCVDNTIYQWTKNLSKGDCEIFSNQSKKDQCNLGVAENTKDFSLCARVVDSYLKRHCYNAFQEELLNSKTDNYLSGYLLFSGIAVVIFLLLLMFFLVKIFKKSKIFSIKFTIFVAVLIGILIDYYAGDHYFTFTTYHIDILHRIMCPPNTRLCEVGSFLPSYTARGMLDSWLIPLFYAALGLLAGIIYAGFNFLLKYSRKK